MGAGGGSMGETVKVQRKGGSLQTTIPKSLARVLDIEEGDTLEVTLDEDKRIVLQQTF